MDNEGFILDQAIFNALITIAASVGTWILKVIWNTFVQLRHDIHALDIKMQEHFLRLNESFVRRDDLNNVINNENFCKHRNDL